jgi:hypothetical protein
VYQLEDLTVNPTFLNDDLSTGGFNCAMKSFSQKGKGKDKAGCGYGLCQDTF